MTEHKISITVPEMTIDQYAAYVGVTTRTVRGWVARGYLPTIKIGKRRLVNVFQRTMECAHDTHTPVVQGQAQPH